MNLYILKDNVLEIDILFVNKIPNVYKLCYKLNCILFYYEINGI